MTEDRLIQDFLYGKHKDSTDFPDSTLFIGTGFEIGGTYENWGFGVFKKVGDGLKTIGSGRTITEAIIKAKIVLKCEHEFKENGWCHKCGGHKTWMV